MPSQICGYCGVHANMVPDGLPQTVMEKGLPYVAGLVQSAFHCDACKRMSLGSTELIEGDPRTVLEYFPGKISEYWDEIGVERWLPDSGGPKIRNLPKNVTKAATEAFKCSNSGQYMSAILMARTTIEATARAHGVIKGSLLSKIDELYDRRLILASTQKAAHAIRGYGNEMAHGDLDTEVTEADARNIVELMELILREAFELPYLADRLSKRSAERKVESMATE